VNARIDAEAALAHLSQDPVMASVIAGVGEFRGWPASDDPLRALCRSIIFQQLSGTAAGTIFRRFNAIWGLEGDAFPEPAQILANFMQGRVQRQNGNVNVQVGDFKLSPAEPMQPLLRSYDDSPILMGIRAENMETLSEPARDAVRVEVLVVEPLGSQNLLTVKIGDDLVKVATHPTFRVKPGDDGGVRHDRSLPLL
jgi:hypothetical protein